MGSMLPYIAYMDPMGRELVATIYPYGGFLSHGAYPQFGSRLNAPKLVKKNREDGEMSKCQPGFYPVNTEKNDPPYFMGKSTISTGPFHHFQ